jgi:hypothetical protein
MCKTHKVYKMNMRESAALGNGRFRPTPTPQRGMKVGQASDRFRETAERS